MAPGVALQSDFTAGELSPSLLARVDLAKHSKGCLTARNMISLAPGKSTKRPGFVLLDTLPGPAIFIEFVFNTDQAYALILGERWMRVATYDGLVLDSGGQVYQIATPYTLEQARRLSYVQSADVVFIACQGVAPQRLERHGHADWRFTAMSFDAPLPAPEWDDESHTITSSSYAKTLDANIAYWDEWISDEVTIRHVIDYDIYKKTSTTITVKGVEFVNEAKDSAGAISPAQLVMPYTYYVTAVNSEGKESGLSEGAEITGPSSNNWQAGDYIRLNWLAVAGAEEYRVYKATFGGRPGYIATVGDTTFQDNNIAPSVGEGAPKYVDPFILEDEDGNPIEDYPGTVGLFEQRLIFASTPKRPQTIWLSKSGDYSNFASYTPVAADSPMELTIASREVSEVNWLVSLRSLILGTPGMEWELGPEQSGAFSATNKKAVPQSYWGSSLKRAIVVGNIILHVSSSGSQVRNLQYDFGSDSYGGIDVSILSEHMIEKHQIVDWTYQKNPYSIVWSVRSDGVLLGMTFQNEHQITAWHRHDTDGAFKAVCSVPHGYEYTLFAIIERDGVYYLERMADRYLGGDPSRAVFLDCASTYEGAEVETLTGLEHLEGKTVGVFSRGAVEAPRKVEGGSITLDRPSGLVTVGLHYTADLETMPVEMVAQDGASVSLKKQINAVNIFFQDSLNVKVGVRVGFEDMEGLRWEKVKWRVSEPYGEPPEPFTGIKHVNVPVLADNVLTVCLRSETPTPMSVLALVSRIEVKP